MTEQTEWTSQMLEAVRAECTGAHETPADLTLVASWATAHAASRIADALEMLVNRSRMSPEQVALLDVLENVRSNQPMMPEPPIGQRCARCEGTGHRPDGEFCHCQTGRDLARMHREEPA